MEFILWCGYGKYEVQLNMEERVEWVASTEGSFVSLCVTFLFDILVKNGIQSVTGKQKDYIFR